MDRLGVCGLARRRVNAGDLGLLSLVVVGKLARVQEQCTGSSLRERCAGERRSVSGLLLGIHIRPICRPAGVGYQLWLYCQPLDGRASAVVNAAPERLGDEVDRAPDPSDRDLLGRDDRARDLP